MNKDFLKMQKLAGIITEGQFRTLAENTDKPTHKSKVNWYYINDNSDYPGPKGRTVPDAEGFDNPKKYKGTELYIKKGTKGWVDGHKFEDEEGNDVEYISDYFDEISEGQVNEIEGDPDDYYGYNEPYDHSVEADDFGYNNDKVAFVADALQVAWNMGKIGRAHV